MNFKNDSIKMRHLFFAVVGAIFINILFQNCSDTEGLEDDSADSFASSLPFAYDVNVDYVSYMSCATRAAEKDGAYYTIKAGAYGRRSGLKLNDSFRSLTTGYTPAQVSDLLDRSQNNGSTALHMVLRAENSNEAIISSGYAEGLDYKLIMGPLSDPAIAQPLVRANGERVNTFDLNGGLFSFAGSLKWMRSEGEADDIRSALNGGSLPGGVNGAILAISYGDADLGREGLVPRGPDTNNNGIYGYGLKLTMREPYKENTGSSARQAFGSAYEARRRLASVEPYSLIDQDVTTGEQWECPESMSFTIVHPNSYNVNGTLFNQTRCNPLGTNPPASMDPEKVQIIRTHFLPSYAWNIDWDRKCAIQKSNQATNIDRCYDPNFNPVTKSIDDKKLPRDGLTYGLPNDPAVVGDNVSQSQTCGGIDEPACPHQVNICYKL